MSNRYDRCAYVGLWCMDLSMSCLALFTSANLKIVPKRYGASLSESLTIPSWARSWYQGRTQRFLGNSLFRGAVWPSGGTRHAPPEKLRHLIVCTVYLVFPYSLLDSCSIYKICIFQWHPGGRVTDTQNTPGAALNMAGNISYQIKENCYQILK